MFIHRTRWQGLVYHKEYAKGRFKQDCLSEYCQFQHAGRPLFQTVGLDQTFYRPPSEKMLAHYAAQVPSGFEICSKVLEEITIPQFPNLPQYGPKANQLNPRFLDAELFKDMVLGPHREYRAVTGPFIFEFQRTGISPEDLIARLDQFLGQLPQDFSYAVEVRNAEILGENYAAMLRSHGAAHVFIIGRTCRLSSNSTRD